MTAIKAKRRDRNPDAARPNRTKRQQDIEARPLCQQTFTVINNVNKTVTCHGVRERLNSGYEILRICCPFCGGIHLHSHGYSPGVTRRLSHCPPPFERREYFITEAPWI